MNGVEYCVYYRDCTGISYYSQVKACSPQEAVDYVRRDEPFCIVLFVAQMVGGWE